MNKDVVIIGAGLTGLTLGYKLRKAGKNVLLIEKNEKPGGVIQTLSENGFLFESGPNTGVLSSAELVDLFDNLKDDCTLEIANPDAKKRRIMKNGKWHDLPSGLFSAIGTPLFSFKDKLRILGEPFRKPGKDPHETLANIVLRRMGRSFLDYAIDPFISGIYAGDPYKLVTKYAMPKLYNLEQEYGSFIKGAIKKRKEPKTELEKRATKDVFSVKGGLQNLTDSMAKGIGTENILLNCKDTTISYSDNKFNIKFKDAEGNDKEIISDKLVTTCGAYVLDKILSFIDNEELKPITNLEYAKVSQVVAGYNKWEGSDLQAFGSLVPTKEKRDVLGILFPSSIFEGRAPKEGALLSIFMGGTKKPHLFDKTDDELKEIALNEIESTLGMKSKPDMIKVFKYPHAIPQYTESSKERFEKIEEIQKKYSGLILAGNIRNGIGMSDRVKQAYDIADELLSL